MKPLAGPSHGESVVAARGDQDTALQLFFGHMMKEIECPADLERTGGVMVLVLDKGLAADQSRQFGIGDKIGPIEVTFDDSVRTEHPGKIDLFR